MKIYMCLSTQMIMTHFNKVWMRRRYFWHLWFMLMGVFQNSKAHPPLHREIIENYVNVKKALEDAKFDYFLRNHGGN